jgi:hypothetical protein
MRRPNHDSDTTDPLRVADVRFTASPANQRVHGVLGYVAFVLNDAFVVDAVQVRRTALGRTTLSFAHRLDRGGTRRFWIRPLTDAVRLEVERQVFEHLQIKRDLAP